MANYLPPMQVQSMRTELTASSLSIPRQRQPSDSTQRDKPGSPFSDQYGDDHQAEWAREEQQVCL
jgi:hypothetical protein